MSACPNLEEFGPWSQLLVITAPGTLQADGRSEHQMQSSGLALPAGLAGPSACPVLSSTVLWLSFSKTTDPEEQ